MNLGLKRFALPMLLGALAAVAIAAPATAAPTGIYSVNTWQSVATSKCLDSNVDGHAYALPCNGGSYQKWTLSGTSTWMEHRDYATGLCLDSNADGRVYTGWCNGGAYQHWARYGDTFRNAATGLCLDGNADGSVYTGWCNGGAYQRWI